jgi:diguanylate cyclase (GGDEF)-like protein
LSKKNITIGRQIKRLVTIAIVTGMSCLALALCVYQLRSTVDARRRSMEAEGYVFASAISDSLANGDVGGIQKVFHATQHLQDVTGVIALDAQDHVLANAGNLVVLSSDIIKGEPSLAKMLQQGLMPVRVDVIRGGEKVGQLIMIGDISNVRQQVLNILLVTLLGAIAALAVALVLAGRLQRRITTPIIQLTQSILALRKAHRYEPTAIANAEGETRTLVDSFNGMVNEIRNRDSALKQLAYYDALTGLPNRASFQQHINDHYTKSGHGNANCTILLLDIDSFKTINDTLGQVIGDALLLNVAAALREAQTPDAIVARLGSDEFGVFVTGTTSADQSREAVAPFVACLYQPMRIFNQELHVSACAGLAFAPEFGETGDILQRHGRLALGQAKREGAGRVISYRHEIGEALEEEAELERGLRGAIAAGELEIHYQPIVDARDGRVEGFEALLRWQRANGSLISPAKFIPIAEKSDLIAELGLWVLQKACLQARAWLDAGQRERFVSVNVSPSQLLLSDFVRNVHESLDAAGLPPELLCLELTESLFIGKSIGMIRKLLLDIKSLGVTVALDDFGTGFSSLAYLENLPFDKLKIDRAFVHKDGKAEEHKPLLRGIASLAHALEIEMVAEGAETAAEVALLKSIGVQAIQGYFYAKPLPSAQALIVAAEIENQKAQLVGPPGLEPGTRRL